MSNSIAVLEMPKRGTLAYLEEFPNEVLTMSFDEYWDNELKNEYKSQFFKNKVTALMSYTTKNHNRVVKNTIKMLDDHVTENQAELFFETRPVWMASCNLNTYPDIFIVEESNMIKRKGYQLAETTPSVIIEVLSNSTEEYDRGDKWTAYKTISSLKQYVLISQDKHLVETFDYQDGEWIYNSFDGENAIATISGLDIPLSKLYQNVDFLNSI
jgi:Uma2 family endonuclease